MSDTTDIEKKSLEAHVELCAQRYRHLETKLVLVDEKLDGLFSTLNSLRTAIEKTNSKQNDRLITWGVGIIATLVSAIAYLINVYIIK